MTQVATPEASNIGYRFQYCLYVANVLRENGIEVEFSIPYYIRKSRVVIGDKEYENPQILKKFIPSHKHKGNPGEKVTIYVGDGVEFLLYNLPPDPLDKEDGTIKVNEKRIVIYRKQEGGGEEEIIIEPFVEP